MYRLGLSRQRIAALVRAEPTASDTTWSSPAARTRNSRPSTRPPPAPPRPLPQGSRPHGRGHRLGLGRRPASRRPVRRPGRTVHGAMAVRAAARSSRGHPGPGLQRRSCPGARVGRTTAGKPRTKPAGTTGSPSSWPTARKATTGPATTTADSEREHTLGVWIHTQRYKHRRGELDPVKVKLLDDAVPGWQAGRTRGRPPRR